MAKIKDFGGNEKELNNIKVHGDNCLGNIKFDKDVMISFTTTDKPEEIIDLFLTTEQAVELSNRLQKVIGWNANSKKTMSKTIAKELE